MTAKKFFLYFQQAKHSKPTVDSRCCPLSLWVVACVQSNSWLL